jgi:hypothetical protein
MSVFRFVLVLVLVAFLFCAMPNRTQARLMTVFSYQEMFEKSDLVVIATPKDKTTDTSEQAFLPNISVQDTDGKISEVKSIGVETVFAVAATFKGDKATKQFTLHHYRGAQAGAGVSGNGPSLVFFDPSDTSQLNSYLLFLVREPDGRFAPTGGQTDPGYKAISRLPLEWAEVR